MDSHAPATVTAMTTNNAPGNWNKRSQPYSIPPAIPPPTMVPPSRPNMVNREFTRTRSIVGGITRGVTALRSTLNDFDSTIMASAHGYSTQDGKPPVAAS
jgi:hypothetical protein